MSPLNAAVTALVLAIAAGCRGGRPLGSQASETSATVAHTANAAATGPGAASTPRVADAARAGCTALAQVLRDAAVASGDGAGAITSARDTIIALDTVQDAACLVAWRNSTSRAMPLNDVFARVEKAGWQPRPKLVSADGPGSEALAYSRDGAACVVMGEEDAEDDSDSTYVPKPGFTIEAACARDRPDPH